MNEWFKDPENSDLVYFLDHLKSKWDYIYNLMENAKIEAEKAITSKIERDFKHKRFSKRARKALSDDPLFLTLKERNAWALVFFDVSKKLRVGFSIATIIKISTERGAVYLYNNGLDKRDKGFVFYTGHTLDRLKQRSLKEEVPREDIIAFLLAKMYFSPQRILISISDNEVVGLYGDGAFVGTVIRLSSKSRPDNNISLIGFKTFLDNSMIPVLLEDLKNTECMDKWKKKFSIGPELTISENLYREFTEEDMTNN